MGTVVTKQQPMVLLSFVPKLTPFSTHENDCLWNRTLQFVNWRWKLNYIQQIRSLFIAFYDFNCVFCSFFVSGPTVSRCHWENLIFNHFQTASITSCHIPMDKVLSSIPKTQLSTHHTSFITRDDHISGEPLVESSLHHI